MAKDLNTMSASELSKSVPQLGADRANEIVNFRDETGGFRSWDDLREVSGISSGMIDNIRDAGVTLGEEE